jgi:hypothetical protein
MYDTKTALLIVGCLAISVQAESQDCPLGRDEIFTEDYRLVASSDQGAVGDVVAVDISLQADNPRTDLIGVHIAACIDGGIADLLEQVSYSALFEELSVFSEFVPLPSREQPQGFRFSMNPRPQIAQYLPTREPLPLLTAYFRLRGNPGDAFRLRFCDDAFRFPHGPCIENLLHYRSNGAPALVARSHSHVPGEVRILPGEPTRPDPPSLPPLARVYPSPVTADQAQILFELTGGVVQPGAREVPLDLFVTSALEFSGFGASLSFPAELLEAVRVEEHTRPGVVRMDNSLGHIGLLLFGTRRRVGQEGERVRVATLYVNLKERAAEAGEIALTFERRQGFLNWLEIHQENSTLPLLPVSVEVEPLRVAAGLLKLQDRPTRRGDVNLDWTLNVTDAVLLLRDIFIQPGVLTCPQAADFNRDEHVDVSDPVALLGYLFLGGPPAMLEADVFCD